MKHKIPTLSSQAVVRAERRVTWGCWERGVGVWLQGVPWVVLGT